MTVFFFQCQKTTCSQGTFNVSNGEVDFGEIFAVVCAKNNNRTTRVTVFRSITRRCGVHTFRLSAKVKGRFPVSEKARQTSKLSLSRVRGVGRRNEMLIWRIAVYCGGGRCRFTSPYHPFISYSFSFLRDKDSFY